MAGDDEHGYDSPEEGVQGDIPARFWTILGTRIEGDQACVWSLTNDRPPFEPYEDFFERRGSRWFPTHGNGGFSIYTPPEILERAARLGYGAPAVTAGRLSDRVRAFLLEGTRTGKLAVLTPSGWPHVTPIWFVLDGDEIVFSTGSGTVKARHLRRDDRVSLSVDEEHPMYAYVHIRGRARIDERSDLREWTTRIARRYMGPMLADAYGRRNAAATELLVRLRPERVIADFDVAGW